MLGRNNFRNLEIISTVSNLEHLVQDLPEYLPQKFRFEVISDKKIRILSKNFSLDCNFFYIDTSEYQYRPDKYFLICARRGEGNLERDYTYTILCTNIYDKSFILANGLSSFYYNEAMIKAGFIAVKKRSLEGWTILLFKGPLMKKYFSIDSFLKQKEIRKIWEIQEVREIEFFPEGKILKFNTLSGEILKFIFKNNLYGVSPIYNNGRDKVMIVEKNNNDFNLIKLPDFIQVLSKDAVYINPLYQQVRDPIWYSQNFDDSTILYNRLVKNYKLFNLFIIKEEGYFDLSKDRYLFDEERKNLENAIQEYHKEWYACDL